MHVLQCFEKRWYQWVLDMFSSKSMGHVSIWENYKFWRKHLLNWNEQKPRQHHSINIEIIWLTCNCFLCVQTYRHGGHGSKFCASSRLKLTWNIPATAPQRNPTLTWPIFHFSAKWDLRSPKQQLRWSFPQICFRIVASSNKQLHIFSLFSLIVLILPYQIPLIIRQMHRLGACCQWDFGVRQVHRGWGLDSELCFKRKIYRMIIHRLLYGLYG